MKWCKLLGHLPSDINFEERTAVCKWCGVGLDVSYDMSNGETYITGIRKHRKEVLEK